MRSAAIILIMVWPGLTWAGGGEPKKQGKTVQEWLGELNSAGVADREKACKALGDFGPAGKAAVAALAGRLKDESARVRVEAINALRRIGPPAREVLPQLLAALDDKDVVVQRTVLQALGGIGPAAAKAVPILVTAARDKDPEKSASALVSLGQIGAATPEAVAVLEEVLAGKDAVAAGSASLALSYLDPGNEIVRAAEVKALRHAHDFVVTDALEVIQRWHEAGPIPKGTTEALLYVLLEKKAAGRDQRLKALAAVAPLLKKDDWQLLQPAAFKDNDAVVLLTASAVLADRFGVKEATAVLRKAAQAPDIAGRRQAAVALVKHSGDPAEGVPVLVELLADKEWKLRQQAVVALGELGEKAATAVPALHKVLTDDKETEVRAAAAEALGRVGKAAGDAKMDLQEAARDKDMDLRLRAAGALLRLGLGGKDEMAVVIGALTGDNFKWRRTAIVQLAGLTPETAKEALPALREVMQDPNPLLRREAYYALARLERK
jgi:HEAT repeat protein